MTLDAQVPPGPLEQKWDTYRRDMKLVNPANKRKFRIIVVGSGLAGGAAAASLAELGYQVDCYCYQDSPRRAHSIAAQGGINAAKNYHGDGDSTWRLFYDTIKGGDYRSREANVYCSTTAHSAVRRSRVPSTRAARRASSSCSGRTAPSRARSAPAVCACTHARRCSMWWSWTGRRAASLRATS
jgi:hypothetical protein